MPVNNDLANEVWNRYAWLRDNGHLPYVEKASKCEDFFVGIQWDPNDVSLMKAVRRPTLTINKIISTISNVLGEQIFNRTDTAFKPRNEGATAELADVLTKVFMQIGDNNQLAWTRSDVFCDGIIGSRGFFDVRLDFTDSLRGEVKIEQLNPKNVLIDSDADEYDPDKWGDVITTRWMSPDQIELLYSAADAKLLRGRQDSYFPWGYDSIDRDRDRFGTSRGAYTYGGSQDANDGNARNIRVIERQWKKLDKMLHFVDIETGDMRVVPSDWDDERIVEYLGKNPTVTTTKKMIQRIRWTVIADNVVLHDDWSPYKHFTVVPYFPYFRRGRTVGLVENLIGPQELLNKVSSQELHIVNTTANSGWIVKRNALQTMSLGELEQRGAQTGLVIEVDELAHIEKITPNATPQGLDRISYKAEESIKSISGVSDYMQGFAREDVAAKSVVANKQSGQANLAKVMDNMNRTDWLLARNILDLVQEYYTEQRLMFITTDRMTHATEEMTVNQVTPEGQIVNNLTIGEYAAVITNQPDRDSFEDSQFDQAMELRDRGIQIPDSIIIQSSKLKNKGEIVKQMEGSKDSPEAQAAAQLKARSDEAAVAGLEADVQAKQTKAQLDSAKAQKELASIGADTGQAEMELEQQKMEQELVMEQQRMENELALKREEMAATIQMKREQMTAEIEMKRESAAVDSQIKQQQSAADAMTKRVAAVEQAKNTPKPTSPLAKPAAKKPAPKKST